MGVILLIILLIVIFYNIYANFIGEIHIDIEEKKPELDSTTSESVNEK